MHVHHSNNFVIHMGLMNQEYMVTWDSPKTHMGLIWEWDSESCQDLTIDTIWSILKRGVVSNAGSPLD